MQRKSLVGPILFSAALLAPLSSCAPSRPAVVPSPHEGVTVTVVCLGETSARVVELYGRAWASEHRASVRVVCCATGDDLPADADVLVIAPFALPFLADAGWLQPVPPAYLANDHPYVWSGLLELYREKLLVWDGKRYAMPILGESLVFCHRTDAAPATWDELLTQAEKAGGAERKPCLPALNTPDLVEREFHLIAASLARRAVPADERPAEGAKDDELFAFHFDLAEAAPRVAGPGFVEALDVLRRLEPYRLRPATWAAGGALGAAGWHPVRRQVPGSTPEQAFQNGQTLFCFADVPALARFQRSPEVRDRFGVAQVPGSAHYYDFLTGRKENLEPKVLNRVPYVGWGGRVGVVPTSAKEPAAAWSFLADLTGPETSRQILVEPAWGGGATRREHFDVATRWDAVDLDPRRTTDLKEVLRASLLYRGLKNPLVRLRTPDEGDLRRRLTDALGPALASPETPSREVMAEVARRWEAKDRGVDPAAFRRAYRLSLGLLP